MKYSSFYLFLLPILLAVSCDHKISMETTVHEDGQLDKIIVFENNDSTSNILGLSPSKGWERNTVLLPNKSDSVKDKTVVTTYRKSFPSVDQANEELGAVSDTLFRVTGEFTRKFRWFYSYLLYAETYHTINHLRMKPDNYLVQEDYAFIDRLPGEGKSISKADAYYLDELNKRIFDVYGERAYLEEYYSLTIEFVKDLGIEEKWIDTLGRHKDNILKVIAKKEEMSDDYILNIMDSLGVPLNIEKVRPAYMSMLETLQARLNFISKASEGTYKNQFNMPWTVVRTNADSLAGTSVFWKPSSIKFLLKDYTMYAECRRLNWWAILVSLAVIALTVVVVTRKSIVK